MPRCGYIGPSGLQCSESNSDGNPLCFWHDRNTPKTNPVIKEKLEQKTRNQESMEGYELSGANLEDAYLMEANLSYATLTRVNLKDGHLFGINLRGARLFKASLEHANLKDSILEGADLLGINLDNTDLDRVKWGHRNFLRNHLEAQKLKDQGDKLGARAKYLESAEIYRSIRKRYEASGASDIAGEFFHLEMVMKRNLMPLFSVPRFWSKLVDLSCGYGELPYRVIGSSITFIILNALIFCIFGMTSGGETYVFNQNLNLIGNLTIFGNALYYSVVSFTTLGYGDFTPISWSKPFAALEAFVGAFMIALFVLAFVKKMTR